MAFLLQPPRHWEYRHSPPFPVWVSGHTQVIRPGSECFNTEPSPQLPAAVFSIVLTLATNALLHRFPLRAAQSRPVGCVPLAENVP